MSKTCKNSVMFSVLLGIIFLIILQIIWNAELPSFATSIFSLVICLLFVSIISIKSWINGCDVGTYLDYSSFFHDYSSILLKQRDKELSRFADISTKPLDDIDDLDKFLEEYSLILNSNSRISTILELSQILIDLFDEKKSEIKKTLWIQTSPQ